jgi:hypothetical protein
MHRFTRLGILAAILAMVVGAVTPAAIQAQEPRPPAGSTVSGEVTDVNPLKVKAGEQEFLLQTAPAVVVNRDGKEVNLGELNKGDKVTFVTNADSSVQRIDVTDPATDERTWLLIGLLVIAAIVVLGLVWYLTQRRKRYTTLDADRGRGRPLSSEHR